MISSISAMQLVQGGFGIATLPLAAARRLPDTSGVKILRCEQAPLPLPIYATTGSTRPRATPNWCSSQPWPSFRLLGTNPEADSQHRFFR